MISIDTQTGVKTLITMILQIKYEREPIITI
jgi:hypothetical protein